MTLEQQVPSGELCIRLNKLGWDVETCFIWVPAESGTLFNLRIKRVVGTPKGWLPAPTVAELGEALGKALDKPGAAFHIHFPTYSDGKWLKYKEGVLALESGTEANIRTKWWIYLKENNLI